MEKLHIDIEIALTDDCVQTFFFIYNNVCIHANFLINMFKSSVIIKLSDVEDATDSFKLGDSNFLNTYNAPAALIHLSTDIKTPPSGLCRWSSSCSRPCKKATKLSEGSLFFLRLHFLYLPYAVCTTRSPRSDMRESWVLIWARPLGWLFWRDPRVIRGPPSGQIISNIRYQSSGGNTLIILPALLITGRELTESTCLGVERSFPAALLRQLPFQLNGVLSGYLYGVKRPAGGWGHFFYFILIWSSSAQIIFHVFWTGLLLIAEFDVSVASLCARISQ